MHALPDPHAPIPMRLATVLLLLGPFLVPACSGSGSGPAPAPRPTPVAHLRVDPAAGVDGRLAGRVSAVVLENEQGGFTENLVAGDPELVLTDPLGANAGLKLADFGPGRFVAVHVSFVPGTLRFFDGSEPRDVVLVGGSIRAPFADVFDVPTRSAWSFELRHRTPVELNRAANGDLTWTPDMEALVGTVTLLRATPLQVERVDRAAETVDGKLLDLDGMATTMRFLSNAVLVLGGAELDPQGFLAGLKTGDVLQVHGVLDARGATLAAFAERVDDPVPGPGNGRKNRIQGTIRTVDKAAGTCSVELFEILIGGRDLPTQSPRMLDVDAAQAKIKWVPRYGRHRGHLPPASLEPDMFVRIDWHGATNNGAFSAHKIDIRSDGRQAFVHRLEGRIARVDAVAGTVVIESTGADFRFGSETYRSLNLSFAADALVVAESPDATVRVGLGDLKIGEPIEVLGIKRAGDALETALLVVRR